MDVLTSRIILHPSDVERSQRFYEETLGLAVFREWGSGSTRGAVYFLGSGLLEVSGSGKGGQAPSDAVRVFIQVRDLEALHRDLTGKGVSIESGPERKPWGLDELVARDPDGLGLVFVEVPGDHPMRWRRD